MKGFKLTDLLGEQSPATATNGGEWDIQHIPLEQIVPAKNNNYRICDIEPLADSIHADGLQAPLVVRVMPDGGQYELISGERRYTAIKLLRDRGLAGYNTAPCKVKNNVSDLAAEIELIRANSTARVLTDQEKVTQAARLSELLNELKSGGVKVPGRKREIIAGIMGVSSAQVGRMESVEKNLAPEAKAEFQQGNMNFSTAYETSLLPPEQQKEVVEDIQQGKKVDIKTVKQRRKPAPEDIPTCPPHYCGTCIPGDCIHNQREESASAVMPPYAPGTPLNTATEQSGNQPYDRCAYIIGVDYGAVDGDCSTVTVMCSDCKTVIVNKIIKSPCWSLDVPKACPACGKARGE